MTFYEKKIIAYIHWNSKNNNGISINSIRQWFRNKFNSINDDQFNEIMNKMIDNGLLSFPSKNNISYVVVSSTDENGNTINYSKKEQDEMFKKRRLNGNVILSKSAIEYIDEHTNVFVNCIFNSGLRSIVSIIISHFIILFLLMP